MREVIRRGGPLRVSEVDYTDPSLTLSGAGWSLNIMCPWRVRERGILWVSCSEPGREDKLWDLIGHDIIDVVPAHGVDPVFVMSADLRLEILADTDVDPWALLLRGRTFVGTASMVAGNPSSGVHVQGHQP